MGVVSVSLPADGTVADVSDYNTPITTIVNEFNGNIDNANIKTGAAIATSKLADDAGISAAKLADGAVTGSKLATTAITLGYAQVTTDQPGIISTTGVQLTGLTAAVTIPAGGRQVKITAYTPDTTNNGNNTNYLQIWDGTVGSGTKLNHAKAKNRIATDSTGTMICIAVHTPAAGAKTYNAGFAVDANTGTMAAASDSPAFILVEVI